jgi:hypothetical protein
MSSPTLTRRALVAGADTTLASASLAIPFATASRAEGLRALPTVDRDPLIDAINAYRIGLADYEAFASTSVTDEERDAYAELSYQPPMAVLDEWKNPAASVEGAVQALSLAVDQYKLWGGGDTITANMLRAALGYFEQTTA